MLTQKQEKFVQGILEGKSGSDAYRAAYSTKNMSDKTVRESASVLIKNPKVTARLKELRDEAMAPSIMSAVKRLEWLSELIRSEKESTGDKLRAVDIMNRMQGEYVTKVEGELKTQKLEDLL